MKLYTSIGPNPRIVRMFAAEKGVTLSMEAVDILAGDCRREPYLSINPLGSTPALVLGSGQVVTEVVAICEYLEELLPGPALIGTTAEERANVRMWTRRIDLGFAAPITLAFRATDGRALFEPRLIVAPVEAGPSLKAMGMATLDFIDTECADRGFVAGETLSLADILLFSFVDFANLVGMSPLESRPWLTQWFARIGDRDGAVA